MPVVINGTSGITGNTGTLISATTIGVGGATPANTGAGITFPVTQSASSDPNTLDDYEEGTFTPQLLLMPSNTNPTGATYGLQSGKYQKVGRWVNITMICVWTNKGTTTQTSDIISFLLPFVIDGSNSYGSASYTQNGITLKAGSYEIGFQNSPGNAIMHMYTMISGGSKGSYFLSDLPTGGEIVLNFSYLATA